MSRKYTDTEIQQAVKDSKSYRQVILKLGLNPRGGGGYKNIQTKIKKLELDISHFTGCGWSKNTQQPLKRSIDDYLNNKANITSHKLKLRLIREGYLEHKCSVCNLKEWNENPIPIELDHIDGNNSNNSLENLRIICPNCHAQTSNYCGKNIKVKRKIYLCKCGNKKSADIYERCFNCSLKFRNKRRTKIKKPKSKNTGMFQRKVDRPSKEELEILINENSWCAIGRKFGVSDNAIRKWARNYNIIK